MWTRPRSVPMVVTLLFFLLSCSNPDDASTATPDSTTLAEVGAHVDASADSVTDLSRDDVARSQDGGATSDAVKVDSGEIDAADSGGWRQHTWGGAYNDEAKSLATAADGGLWIAGYTESVGAGDWDGLLMRTTPCGSVTWARTYGAAKKDALHSVIATTGGGAAAVGISYSFKGFVEAWLVRVNDAGGVVWTASYGGDGFDQATALTETTDQDFVVLGETYNFGPGTPKSHNMMLLRVSGKDGKIAWEQTLGGGTDGDAGFALLRTDGVAGNILVAGATESFGQGRDDVWVTKLDPAGKMLWSWAIGGPEDDEARTIAPNGQGGFFVTGFTRTYSHGKADIFLLNIDAAGAPIWMRHYGNSEKDRAYGAFPSGGGILMAGHTLSFGDGDTDAWLMRVSAEGSFDWMRLLRGKGNDEIVATLAAPDGGIFFAGRTESFGAGQRDVWYGRARSDGAVGCHQHTLSSGKVKQGKAKPIVTAVKPSVATGAVRRSVSVKTSLVTTLSGVAACTPSDCE